MGDIGSVSAPWMPVAPRALPLGKANVYPLDELHVGNIPHYPPIRHDVSCFEYWVLNRMSSLGCQCVSTNLGLGHWAIAERGVGVRKSGVELSPV